MDYGISRENALKLLKEQLPQANMLKHSLASEAVMRALARHLNEDENLWALTGLLHDLDYNETRNEMQRHGLVSAQMLSDVAPAITAAIKAHNADELGIERSTPIDYAITAGETITGLITAVTLIYPDKKLKSVKVKSITKRMKDKRFAENVSREKIMLCQKLGLELNDFCALALAAMQEIDSDLGLA